MSGQCDILIAGGEVIDGSGEPRRRADVAITGDRIVAVGDLGQLHAGTIIDAAGLIVAPGFIDAHTHDDRAVLSGPDMTNKISQGVTTVVAGNCGISIAPLVLAGDPPPPMNLLGGRADYGFPTMADYGAAIDGSPPALNVAMLTGHSTLRVGVMDELSRPATDDEIARMADRLDEALDAGAIGFSTGLAYPTAIEAPAAEVTALVKRLEAVGGVYTTHMRDEGDHVIEAIEETLETARVAGVRVVISHHKCSGSRNFGRSRETLALIAAAQAGQDVHMDVYPYIASSTVLLPSFMEDCPRVLITWSEPHPEQAGRDLADIADDWDCSWDEAAERLLPAGAIYFQMDEGDLQRILAFPNAMIGSDGLPHDEKPHPRLWGTFPRVLGHYCRDIGLFSLEEAVRRMTGVPADVFGLKDRGALREGAYADITLFDKDKVIDVADFTDSKRPSAGIDLVMVNGRAVWRRGEWTGNRPGRLCRRS
jgi:N-acyl-D-amino-acid deacylase